MSDEPTDQDSECDELSEFQTKFRNLKLRVTQLELECESLGRSNTLLAAEYARVLAENERLASGHTRLRNQNQHVIRGLNSVMRLASDVVAEARSELTPMRGSPPRQHDNDAMPKVVQMGPRSA
jgi:chromosome segregation ATPase